MFIYYFVGKLCALPVSQPGEVCALRAPHWRPSQAQYDGGGDEGVKLRVELGRDVRRIALKKKTF